MSPNVGLLRWISFFSEFRVYGPFAVIYYAQVAGSYTLAMSVFAAAAVTSALMELPSGLLSDGIGRKPTLLLGSFCSVAGVVLLALAQDASLLLLGGMLGGVASALFSGNNDALLYESLALTGQQDTFHHEYGGIASMAHFGVVSCGPCRRHCRHMVPSTGYLVKRTADGACICTRTDDRGTTPGQAATT